MATFTAIKNRGGGRGALAGVLRYTQQEEKTLWEGHRLVSGWNCTAQSALSEMQLTKERFRKTDGRQYYHFVQSFSEQDNLTPQEVHAIGLELAKREFPDFEVLVATHIDTDHLHNHLVVNSVSFQDGHKLHQSAADLQAHRQANDKICIAHGLEILPPPQKQVEQKRMNTREYRSAAKGESWKFRLINTVDQCMRYASTREDFISLMESEGYQVRWTDSRKNITYTTPQGMKCRDDRLHESKYTKEVMEREFRVRAEIIYRGTETAETAEPAQQSSSPADGIATSGGLEFAPEPAGTPGGQCRRTGGPAAGAVPAGGAVPHPGADGGPGAGCGPNTGSPATGWEEERAALLSAQIAPALHPLEQTVPGSGDSVADWGRAVGVVVQLGKDLEHISSDLPVRDATTMHQHGDRKLRQKERQKKIALGHKPDDHEDEIDLTLKGY